MKLSLLINNYLQETLLQTLHQKIKKLLQLSTESCSGYSNFIIFTESAPLLPQS